LDGAEIIVGMPDAAPPQFKNDRRATKATLEEGRVKVTQETRGPGGELRAFVEREWSLSEDGNTLTLRSKLSNGPSPTLVFRRSQSETARSPEINFTGTWELDLRKSDARARQGNVSGPLAIVQTASEIQLHTTINGKHGFERFRLDGEKDVSRLLNGLEVTVIAKLTANGLEVKTENDIPGGGKAKIKRRYSISKDGKTLNVSNGWMKLVYIKVDSIPRIASQSTDTGPQVKIVNPRSYSTAALELVKNQRSVKEVDLEIIGEPVLKPDRLGFPPNIPSAIVLINLNRGTAIQGQAIVTFADGRPPGILLSEKSVFSEGTMDRAEYGEVANELDSFFSAALDVSLGSERFFPYLPDDIRSLLRHRDRKVRMYMPPGAVDPSWREKLAQEISSVNSLDGINGWKEKLSDNELRRFVAAQLDVVVQQSLLIARGYVKEAMDQASRHRPQLLVSDPREFIKILEESVLQNRRVLAGSGILIPENLRRSSSYVKRILGQGFIVKEVSKPDPCPCFLSPGGSETLYVISLGSPSGGPKIHFRRTDGRLQIACAAIP
jgi:hypothetical protein